MSQEEIVAIVDADNHIIGSSTRSDMRLRGLRHRASYILVFDHQDRIFVQKRTADKDIYPGFYDVAAGGVVLAGETYAESARRELAEELGIRGTPLTPQFDFYHEDGRNRVWAMVFDCRYAGDIVLQPEEIESGDFLHVPFVLDMSLREKFTPDGLYALRRYVTSKQRNLTAVNASGADTELP